VPLYLKILYAISRATIGIRVALNPVFPAILKLEKELLSQLRELVSQEYRSIYDEHVSKINFMQRQSGNRLSVLFNWKFPGRYDWERSKYFEPREGTKKQLNFKISFPDGEELHGNLVSIDGVLCNITFGEDITFFKKYTTFEVIAKSGVIKKKT